MIVSNGGVTTVWIGSRLPLSNHKHVSDVFSGGPCRPVRPPETDTGSRDKVCRLPRTWTGGHLIRHGRDRRNRRLGLDSGPLRRRVLVRTWSEYFI